MLKKLLILLIPIFGLLYMSSQNEQILFTMIGLLLFIGLALAQFVFKK